MPEKRIVVCIPAYNEENTLPYVIYKCLKYTKEILVIDDGSTDRTARIARMAGAKVVSHRKNLGYGGAIRTCIFVGKKQKADCLVIIDSDGQHDPDQIPTLVDPILKGEADLVIGSRFKSKEALKHIPRYRMIGIQTITQVFNLGAHMSLTDSQSGFRAYSRKALESLKVTSDKMDASMEILFDAKDHKFRIIEVPIKVSYKGLKGSSEHPVSHGMSVLGNTLKMIRVRYPMRFFGWTGLSMVFLTIPVFIYSRIMFQIESGVLPIGSMFVITFLSIMGSYLIFTGIMLQGVNRVTVELLKEMAR